jgi:16S rRNA (guanine966-N2)-methyltransferase
MAGGILPLRAPRLVKRPPTQFASAPGKVRIIAGQLRNSRLAVPDMPGLRPTSERVRETLFNWLAPWIAGSRCLDLFAGTGALGIEAASRGAAAVVMVEREPSLARALRENVTRLGVSQAEVVERAAEAYLSGPAQPCDVVFVDPPYAARAWDDIAQRLSESGWLKPGALIYVERGTDDAFHAPPGWALHREGRTAGVRYALYRAP